MAMLPRAVLIGKKMAQTLDLDVVNLAKAIRQVETGNNPKQGASGELPSRYQYMPETWKATAAKYLGDANAPLTLENENKATYLKIKAWKDAGYKPDQIASMWNSGKPDWQGNVGVNSAGVKFDTPNYVKKVGVEYQKIKGVSQSLAPAEISETKQADIESGKRYGAFLPAKTENPNIVAEAGKTLANIPSSAFNFAKGAIDILNPVSTIKKIGETVGGFKELVKEAGGVGKAITSFGKAIPGAAYESFVPEAAKGLITAGKGTFTGQEENIEIGLQTAQRAITNDPVGQILPFLVVAKGGASALDRAGVTKGASAAVDTAISKIAKPVIKTSEAVAGKVTGAAKGTVSTLGSQIYGTEKGTLSRPLNYPEAFSKKAIANTDRASLGQEVQSSLAKKSALLEETGPEYKPIRESGVVIKVDPNFVDSVIKDTTGLKIKNGKLQSSGAAVIRKASDVRALQYIRDFWKPIFEKGELTANEFLNFRTDLADLARFERQIGKSMPLESMAKIVRARLNEAYRPQLEGLSELDESFANQVAELNRLSKGLVDKNEEITDAGMARIANLSKNKPNLAAQLEQISPGIADKIKNLQAIVDIERASGIKVGAYSKNIITGGAFLAGGPFAAIISLILTNPKFAVPILRGAGLIKNSAAVRAVVNALRQGATTINQLPNAGQSEPQKIIPQELSPGKQKVNVKVVEPKLLMLSAPAENAPRVSIAGGKTINLGKKAPSTIAVEEMAIAQKQHPGASKIVEGEYTEIPKPKPKAFSGRKNTKDVGIKFNASTMHGNLPGIKFKTEISAKNYVKSGKGQIAYFDQPGFKGAVGKDIGWVQMVGKNDRIVSTAE